MMKRILTHLVYYAETYLLLPLVLALIVGSLHFYQWATGRPSVDDPAGEIVASLEALSPLVLLIALVGFVQSVIIGYRGEKEECPIRDDIFDVIVFLALLFSFAKIGRML